MTTDRNNEMSSDEVRRQLRSAQAEHEATLSTWRGSLDELLNPGSGASTDQKASFLGVPTRRTFMFGGVVLAGGAVLAACGKKKTAQTPESGTLPTVPSSTTTTAPGSASTDKVLLQTAQSIEILAIQTYQKAIDSGLLTDQTIKDVAVLFQSQHQDHSDALARAITAAGGKAVTTPNEYLASNVVDKAVSELTDQKSVLVLARDLENLAAQTYVDAGGVFSTPELRKTGMSIGETEARHITVLNLALGYSPVPLALMPTAKAIDPKGYVTG
jgi:rubrerythrin